jgi:hypothetical protein
MRESIPSDSQTRAVRGFNGWVRCPLSANLVWACAFVTALFFPVLLHSSEYSDGEECLGLTWRQEALVDGFVGTLCPEDELESEEVSVRMHSASELLAKEIRRVRDCRFEFVDEMDPRTSLGREYGQYHGGLLSLNGFLEAVLMDVDNIETRLSLNDLLFFMQDISQEEIDASRLSCLSK